MGLRAVLNAVVKRKIPSPRRELNPRILLFFDMAKMIPHSAATRSHH
jgi:hypothetical protein